MELKHAKNAVRVVAKTTGYGRLKKDKGYAVIHTATLGNKFVFVLDETGNVNGYHIRNFRKGSV